MAYHGSLSDRQATQLGNNAAHGWVADAAGPPTPRTLRQLSMEAARSGTVRQTVGAGARALWSVDGHDVDDIAAAEETAELHLEASARMPGNTSYAAALFDPQGRPTDTLIMPTQRFGSHLRPPTESHDASAERGDHRGHGASQAQTIFPPGLHRALMTSQSPEMNTAVQLQWERMVDGLMARGRQVFWEVHNEFAFPTEPGMLPRASHQRFVIFSVDANGEDFRVHVNASVSQR